MNISESARRVVEFALMSIQRNPNGDYSTILETVGSSVKNIPLLTTSDIEFIRSEVRTALEQKGIRPEDADYLVSNALDGMTKDLRYNLLTAHDILTAEYSPPQWVVPNLLLVGLVELAGRPKIGKSWLALQFACAVAHGGVVFGEKVERAPVLYIATEDSPRRLKERMKIQSWNVNNRLTHFLTLGDFQKNVGDLSGNGAQKLAELIRANRYHLVVVDTLSRCFTGDQNDVEKMTAALTPLQQTAHELEASVLIVDHHRKGVSEHKDPVCDILGSTAKGAIVDTALGLYRERGKGEAELHICGRDIEDNVLNLRMDWSIGAWQKTGDSGTPMYAEGQRKIMEFLETVQEASLREICEGVGKSYDKDRGTVHKDLKELIFKRRVSMTPDGKKYCLVDNKQQQQQCNTDNEATEQPRLIGEEISF